MYYNPSELVPAAIHADDLLGVVDLFKAGGMIDGVQIIGWDPSDTLTREMHEIKQRIIHSNKYESELLNEGLKCLQ